MIVYISSLSGKVIFWRFGEIRAVPCQALIYQGDNFIQRVGLQPLLLSDATDQAINALNVFRAAKKIAGGGRGVGKTFNRLGVLLEWNQVGIVGAQCLAEVP